MPILATGMRSNSAHSAQSQRRSGLAGTVMHAKARQGAFTLLEILVVIVIIGIIAAMATLSVGVATGRKGTEKEIQRIQDLLVLGSEESVAQGREFALTFYAREYQFSTWDPLELRWKPLGDDAGPFVPRSLPPETIVDLELEGRPVKLAEQRPVEPEEKQESDKAGDTAKPRQRSASDDLNQPHIFMDSSGEITPFFKLHLRPAIGVPGISLSVAEDGKLEQIRDER